ncbi:MAG: glycosyltransferase family 4 protein [Alphaproteobacteria bacterium]
MEQAAPAPLGPIAILFPSAGRKSRLHDVEAGLCPKEFFYGALNLSARGTVLRYADTRQDPDTILANARLWAERARNRLSGFGLSQQRVAALKSEIDDTRLAVSFTDGFSLSLGRYRHLLGGGTVLAGGFHGLSDVPDEVAPPVRSWARAQIRQAVLGLDHLFFFGEADRQEAIRRFQIPEQKTSLFLFGVDTDFWCPGKEEPADYVLSVGSDPKRDYATLLAASIEAPLRIITRLGLQLPKNRGDVEIIRGSYHNVAVTDTVLRDLYREAAIVVVPVRNVFQPSGYSVTLQAMACGKPVVLSRIKGLWDPEAFVSGENCVLVEPENPRALADAIAQLRADPAFRNKIGAAARATAVRFFALQRMNDSLAALVERCRHLGEVGA